MDELSLNRLSETVTHAISEAVAPLSSENEHLRESLDEVRAMMDYDNEGGRWLQVLGKFISNEVEGLDLEEVQIVSKKARTSVALSSLPKRAVDLHSGYVFGNGVEISDTIRETGSQGRPKGNVTFYEDTVNQESLFSGAAKRELQYARFTDGNVIVFCETGRKKVRRIPVYEIKDVLVNPEHPDEVWAWLREWKERKEDGSSTVKRAWAYTNRYPHARKKTIAWAGESVRVLPGVTAVDLRCNRQVGWVFGIPDALAGLHWATAYGEVLRYGQIVNESLAKIIYKVTNTKTRKGAQNVGVKLGGAQTGGAAVLGEGQDIQMVNASQRTYDFTAARPLAAMAAAAWNVTTPDLLADSSAAGSSYGSLNALTPGMQNAMNTMRDEWTQFYVDIFVACGLDRPTLTWPPMNEPDTYRKAQELSLYSVALSDEEFRAEVLDRLDIPGKPGEIPPLLAARGEAPKQAASPDQGVPNNTGGMPSTDKNDLAQEMRRNIQDEDFLNDLRGLVERLEATTKQ